MIHKASVQGDVHYFLGECSCGWRSPTTRTDRDSAMGDALCHLNWCAALEEKGSRKSKRRLRGTHRNGPNNAA